MIKRRPSKRGSKTPKRRKQRKAQKADCDKAWSLRIRAPGVCHFVGKIVGGKVHQCLGGLQAMHLIPRYYHGTRFDIENGLPGCARVHYHYTIRKEEWGAFMLEHWGPDKFREMWAKAMKITKPDYAEILASLRSDPEPKPERVVFEEAS